MVVIASPPKSDSCGLISSRLLLQTFTLLLLCNYHHGKKSFGEKELYPTTPWQLMRKSKYFPKKIPTSTSAWRMLWWTADPLNKASPNGQGSMSGRDEWIWAWLCAFPIGQFPSQLQEWVGPELNSPQILNGAMHWPLTNRK